MSWRSTVDRLVWAGYTEHLAQFAAVHDQACACTICVMPDHADWRHCET